MPKCDIAIVGAGPYGLSTAAHLGSADGMDVRVFGEPMSFWEKHMPAGMLLRSPLAGTHLSDPKRAFTLDGYQSVSGNHVTAPLPLKRFIDYGRWFQRQAVPNVQCKKVDRLERQGENFRLTLDGGESWQARRVIIAAGIVPFARRPAEFSSLPSPLASHTCEHQDLGFLKGKRVIVIGGGQSALESAALLNEMGCGVEVIVRAPVIHWLWRRSWMHTFWPVAKLLYAPADVGQAGISQIVARPNWFRSLPRTMQDRLAPLAIRPAGAAWLKPRCRQIPIATGRSVLSVMSKGGQVVLRLSDGTERRADHVLLATGYRVDITRYPFLDQALLAEIRLAGGYPQLNGGFESSVPGLHFLGAPAAWSFGPLMRFVAGADFASHAVARKVLGKMAASGS